MKTIMVCTDFSPAARNAAFYALSLAGNLQARLVLVNTWYPQPVAVTGPEVVATADEMQQLSEHQLKHEVCLLHASHQMQVLTSCREGSPVKSILETAENWNADLIVAGMKVEGRHIRRIFGSTVTGLIRHAKIPLIVVPENAIFEKPDAIAIAWEADAVNETDPRLLEILRQIGESFEPAVYLVHVSKNRYKEAFAVLNRPFRLQKLLFPLQPELENIHGKDIAAVLCEFVEQHNVGMLALLPHKHSLLERMFMKSATRQLVFEASVPLLILPGIQQDEGK